MSALNIEYKSKEGALDNSSAQLPKFHPVNRQFLSLTDKQPLPSVSDILSLTTPKIVLTPLIFFSIHHAF